MRPRLFLGVVFILLALLALVVTTGVAQDPEADGVPQDAEVMGRVQDPDAPCVARDPETGAMVPQVCIQALPTQCQALTMTHDTTHFRIHYNLRHTGAAGLDDAIRTAEAEALGDVLEAAWDLYVTDPNFGFREPLGTGTVANPQRLSVCVYDRTQGSGCGCWCTGDVPCDYMRIDSSVLRRNLRRLDIRRYQQTPPHELFHRVQYRYDKRPEGNWSLEGTASCMQDKLFGGPDSLDALVDSSYLDRVSEYLADPGTSLLDHSYAAGLFWTYFMQTCGAVRDEPELGMDAMRIFWEQTLTYDGVEALDHAIQLAPRCDDLHSMEDLFHQFIVANYIKLLGNVSERYQYADEHGSAGTLYDDVEVEYGPEPISPGTDLSHAGEVLADHWQARYYVGEPDAACDWVQVELDGLSWAYMLMTIVGVDSGDAVYYDLPSMWSRGSDFVRTVYSDGFDEVVAIVGTTDQNTNFDIEMSCVAPTLEILEPEPGQPAFAGDPLDPRPFMVRVAVTSGGSPVVGLVPEAFDVQVGSGDAEVLSALYVQDEYWLVVDPRTQTVSGDGPWNYDLTVELAGGVSDSVTNGVQYDEHVNFDQVLVIDVSESMESPVESPKLQAAKNAALLLMDETHDDDRMGAVTFHTEANSVWQGVQTLTGEFGIYARTMIRNLVAGDCTSVGAGLQQALQAFEDSSHPGLPENPDAIILLSDGQENTSPCWKEHSLMSMCAPSPHHDCRTGPYVQGEVEDSGIPVHTIALGPGAHEALMDEISTATGGEPLFVPFSASLAASAQKSGVATGPQQVDNWQLGISDAYDYLGGRVRGRTRIHSEQVTAPDTGTYFRSMTLDDTIVHATFAVAHDTPYSSLQHKVTLLPPVGNPIVPGGLPSGATYRSDEHHNVYEIPNPEPGEWQVRVDYYDIGGPPPGPYEFLIMVSGESQTSLEVMIGAPIADRLTGAGIPIFVAFLGPEGLLPGATISATVVANGTNLPIALRDDGLHGDGEADDGLYGAIFAQTIVSGNHTVLIEGQEGDATRQAMASFHVEADADGDGDGLPDGYENRNGLDPTQDDSGEDPDWDLLDNAMELNLGTDPHNADTDGGGQADNSELLCGSDPVYNPDDDAIHTPTGFQAIAGNGEVEIRYNLQPNYETLWLHWSTDPNMPDFDSQYIEIDPTGVYVHQGLTNGTTYYYVLRAFRWTGCWEFTGYTSQVSATPKEDPVPPYGGVWINDDADATLSRDVVLTIEGVDDGSSDGAYAGPRQGPPAEMRIGDDWDLTGASWEPFATSKDWHLSGAPGEQGYVYIQFRDAAGNVSPTERDGIRLPVEVYLPVILRNKP